MIRPRMIGVAVAALVALLAPVAGAGLPTEQLRGAIERVVKTLENPLYKGENRVLERRAAVRKIANEIFDFGEIARRSLGRHWQGRSDAEHEEFVTLFADLLERSYISKIDQYGGEKIVYTGEKIESDNSVVSTKLVTKNGTEVPIDYRLVKRGERWLVYDVSIEGVSLVSNYRTQFNKIIQTASYAELIRRMKSKQAEVSLDDEPKKKPARRTTGSGAREGDHDQGRPAPLAPSPSGARPHGRRPRRPVRPPHRSRRLPARVVLELRGVGGPARHARREPPHHDGEPGDRPLHQRRGIGARHRRRRQRLR